MRIIAAEFVRPFRKSGKNDANDAEAICTAARQANLRLPAPVRELVRDQIVALDQLEARRSAYGEQSAAHAKHSEGAQRLPIIAGSAPPRQPPSWPRWAHRRNFAMAAVLARIGYHKTLVAIANKHARIIWALLVKGECDNWSDRRLQTQTTLPATA